MVYKIDSYLVFQQVLKNIVAHIACLSVLIPIEKNGRGQLILTIGILKYAIIKSMFLFYDCFVDQKLILS